MVFCTNRLFCQADSCSQKWYHWGIDWRRGRGTSALSWCSRRSTSSPRSPHSPSHQDQAFLVVKYWRQLNQYWLIPATNSSMAYCCWYLFMRCTPMIPSSYWLCSFTWAMSCWVRSWRPTHLVQRALLLSLCLSHLLSLRWKTCFVQINSFVSYSKSLSCQNTLC